MLLRSHIVAITPVSRLNVWSFGVTLKKTHSELVQHFGPGWHSTSALLLLPIIADSYRHISSLNKVESSKYAL